VSPTVNPLHGLEKRALLHVTQDLSPRPASDVLTTLNGHDQVELPSVGRLKGSGPDPPVEIELQPVLRRLEHFQTHTRAELPEQCPVLLGPEVFLFRQGSGLALRELA